MSKIHTYIKDNYQNKKILILGFGLEGKSTAKFLQECGLKFSIADKNKSLKINPLYNTSIIKIICGESYLQELSSFDFIFISPGVKVSNQLRNIYKDKIISQTELFLQFYHKQIIGVSGTKGKSTISSLIYHILDKLGFFVLLGGNIGKPLFDLLPEITIDSIIVAELSCHQLQKINNSPKIAVLTNIFKEHLDYYTNFLEYKETKFNLFKYQFRDDYLIFPNYLLTDNDFTKVLNNYLGKKVVLDDNTYIESTKKEKFIIPNFKGSLYGKHNIQNQRLALLAVSYVINEKIELFKKHLATFTPLEHRLEKFMETNSYIFINDSISTIQETTIEALNTFSQEIEAVYIGGFDRGEEISYNLLLEKIIARKVNFIFLLPDSGIKIITELQKKFPLLDCATSKISLFYEKQEYKFIKITSLIESFKYLKLQEKDCNIKKKIILFSPAAPSYNKFKDFAQRGLYFKTAIMEYFGDKKNAYN